jgi:hypothetical protein
VQSRASQPHFAMSRFFKDMTRMISSLLAFEMFEGSLRMRIPKIHFEKVPVAVVQKIMEDKIVPAVKQSPSRVGKRLKRYRKGSRAESVVVQEEKLHDSTF